MRYLEEFRQPEAARGILEKMRVLRDGPPMRVMEVCGTHTVAIARHGLRPLLSETVALVSGPGCPVCVTPGGYVDAAVALARREGTILATFGDMIRVPGSGTSLERERGRGADVRVVYSPLDAVRIAVEEPGREVVFLGVGFETTAPAIAASVLTAAREGVANYSVLSSMRTIPEAMEALALDPEVMIEGYLCPAHVSAIIGADAYRPLAERLSLPCVVAGFEPLDILCGIYMLLRQKREGRARVENEYSRVVGASGNGKARGIMDEVLVKTDIAWRGIGVIPGTGLAIAEAYAPWDARRKFGIEETDWADDHVSPCRCGDVLKGKIRPSECPLFGTLCTPDTPVGPCMVSSEGSCAASHKFEIG
jgi:hydrogenase expression/formation protein HypD